jgi:hypothetical protein
MKKIILLILFVITFSSLCYGQDDFETEVGLPPMPIIISLGTYKCNCTVNDDITYKTKIIFYFAYGFQMYFYTTVPPYEYYYHAHYFPTSPFIRIFDRGSSGVRGWGFKFSGIILLRIENEGISAIHSIDCVGIRLGL